MNEPRSHGFHERFQSSLLIITESVTLSTSSGPPLGCAASQSVSPMANSPTATMITLMPSYSSVRPKVKRSWPDWLSTPIMPRNMPTNKAVRPRRAELPSTAATVTKDNIISEKYSAGPNFSANFTTGSAMNVMPIVPIVPATKEPIAAVAKAAPARPRLAILLPSSEVTMVALSPGVFSRIEVVDPPYIAP